MSHVDCSRLSKRYGPGPAAVDGIDLAIERGEFVVLLGPSGCGKTTTLRMIAGLEIPSVGSISIDGRDVTRLRPSQRDVGFVFQFYALYPHFTVAENLSFPLECAGVPAAERAAIVQGVATRLGLSAWMRRRPRQLSGGDQQRVALARAMVRKPAVYLMDEPLGTLDAQLRLEMCEFIRQQQLAQGTTTVYVTHDQEEAMRLADRVVVMSAGRILQDAAPLEVYDQPADRFVAHFVGSPGMNFLEGSAVSRDRFRPARADVEFACAAADSLTQGSRELVLGIRPEFVRVGSSGALRGRVMADEDLGASRALHVDTACGRMIARVGADGRGLRGEEVFLDLDPRGMRWFSAADGARLW